MTSWMRNQLTKLYNAVSEPVTAATRDALAERLQGVPKTTSLLYSRMMENIGYGQERLKDVVEKEAEEEEQQQEEDVDLTLHEHERPLKGAYRSFVISGTPQTDIDSYFDQTKPHVKTLIKNQVKEMGSAKIIMTLWVRWEKPIESLIELDPEDSEDDQDIGGNVDDKGRPGSSLNPNPKEMDKPEKEEMNNKLNEWYGWLVDHVPMPIKKASGKTFLKAKNSMLGLYGVKMASKGDAENQKQTEDNTSHKNEGDNYIRVEMPFNSLMTEFFQASDISDLIQRMFVHIKTQVENPKMPESGFSIDKITHLYINFYRLVMTRGSSYNELPEWIKSKKAVINPQNKDEECFKWAAIAALHHEEIKNKFERISLLKPYENRYNWKGLEFPVSIKKIDKFEKNNPGIAVNVLFSNNKNQNIYTARRSERNVKCKKQVNLLMIVDGEKRYYTAIKDIYRLLSKLNGKTRRTYHFCMNCLNGFRTESARDKHYEYCSSNGHVMVKMSTEKEKWLKFHDGQYQFMLPFILYADFEGIFKPVDEPYRDKMNTMKTERKVKASYTEKTNTHVPSGWCVHSTFACGDVLDPLKMYRGKDCVEKFVECI